MSVFGFEVNPELIAIIPGRPTKQEALEHMIAVVERDPAVRDAAGFRDALFERERAMSTGIGGGLAIPHVRLAGITKLVVGVGVAPEGVEYRTLDHQPVYVMILFAAPEGADREYLRLLAQIMSAVRADHGLFQRLIACRTPAEIATLLNSDA